MLSNKLKRYLITKIYFQKEEILQKSAASEKAAPFAPLSRWRKPKIELWVQKVWNHSSITSSFRLIPRIVKELKTLRGIEFSFRVERKMGKWDMASYCESLRMCIYVLVITYCDYLVAWRCLMSLGLFYPFISISYFGLGETLSRLAHHRPITILQPAKHISFQCYSRLMNMYRFI